MAPLVVAFVSVVLVLPREYHIDFSGWNGVAHVLFDVRITAMDGTVYKTSVELFPGSDAEDARGLLWVGLKNAGYRGHKVGKGILVLEAAKKSPIRSVKFASKDWKPDVRVVIKRSEKK